jgi:hypothetical protein
MKRSWERWLSWAKRPTGTVVIAGCSRSGTTALFYTVKHAMPRDTLCLFEPLRFDATGAITANVLVKILVRHDRAVDFASFDGFGKKVLIIRDPRDNIVSRLLYEVYNACCDDATVDAFVQLLRRKEAEPHSVSLLQIIDLADRITGRDLRARSVATADLVLDFQRSHADYFVYRYEDFVRADTASLEQYLELALASGPLVVPADLSRVARTRTSGDWRNWLTPADVEFFRPRFASFMRHNDYADDWTLAERPSIPPEHASHYVLRIAAERRATR